MIGIWALGAYLAVILLWTTLIKRSVGEAMMIGFLVGSLAGQPLQDLPECLAEDAHPGLRGARGDMRRDDDVGPMQQGMIGRQRFRLGHIEPGSEQTSSIERVEQRIAVHETATGGVDEHHTALHLQELVDADHASRRVAQRHMQGDDIGRADSRVGTLVSCQVDPVAGDLDGADERLDERAVLARHSEHRTRVLGVGVHVQQPHTL